MDVVDVSSPCAAGNIIYARLTLGYVGRHVLLMMFTKTIGLIVAAKVSRVMGNSDRLDSN